MHLSASIHNGATRWVVHRWGSGKTNAEDGAERERSEKTGEERGCGVEGVMV